MMAERVPIDTYCEKKIPTLQKTYDGLIDYVDISSVDNTEKKIISYQTIESNDAPSRAKQLLKKGDVLVSTVRPNLNAVAVVEEETENLMVGSTGYCVLRCKDNMDVRYLFNFCQSQYFVDDMSSQATGASYPAVSNGIVRSALIPCYSIEEQREIAEKMDTVSELLALCKQQLAELDELIKSRFIELFGDPVDNPKSYLVKSLQELIDMGYITYHLDGNHGGDYPRSEEFVDSGVPYIGANSIVNGEIDFSMAKYLTAERAGKLRKGIAQNEDVLFAHNATVGPTVVLHTTESKVILSTSLTAYRCNKAKLLPNYLKAFMQSEGFVRQYSGEMKQTTRNQVPITAQKKYLFLVPPIVEQEQFATFVEQTDKSKLAVQQSIAELEELKKSLMQKYFG